MNVNKKQLADAFEVSTRTITEWQNQGRPALSGNGSGGNRGECQKQDTEHTFRLHKIMEAIRETLPRLGLVILMAGRFLIVV